MGNQAQSQDLEHEQPRAGEQGRDHPRQVQSQDVAAPAEDREEPQRDKPTPQPDRPPESRRETLGNESDVL